MENERVIVSPFCVVTVMSTYWPAQNLIGESSSISMPRMSWVSCSNADDAAVETLDRDRLRQKLLIVVEQLDLDIGRRQRPAQQDVAEFLLHVVEREGRIFQQIDFAFEQHALAGGALALLAAVRQRDALTEGGVEHGLAFPDTRIPHRPG